MPYIKSGTGNELDGNSIKTGSCCYYMSTSSVITMECQDTSTEGGSTKILEYIYIESIPKHDNPHVFKNTRD